MARKRQTIIQCYVAETHENGLKSRDCFVAGERERVGGRRERREILKPVLKLIHTCGLVVEVREKITCIESR